MARLPGLGDDAACLTACRAPGVGTSADADPETAPATHRHVLGELADSGARAVITHTPGPTRSGSSVTASGSGCSRRERDERRVRSRYAGRPGVGGGRPARDRVHRVTR